MPRSTTTIPINEDVHVPLPFVAYLDFPLSPQVNRSLFETCAESYFFFNGDDTSISLDGLCR